MYVFVTVISSQLQLIEHVRAKADFFIHVCECHYSSCILPRVMVVPLPHFLLTGKRPHCSELMESLTVIEIEMNFEQLKLIKIGLRFTNMLV